MTQAGRRSCRSYRSREYETDQRKRATRKPWRRPAR